DGGGWRGWGGSGSMPLTCGQAGPGVVALTGELAAGSGLLALGFGDRQDSARAAAQASLDAGYDATAAAFARGWQAWMAGLTLPGPAQLAAAGAAGAPGLARAPRGAAVGVRAPPPHTRAGAPPARPAHPRGD